MFINYPEFIIYVVKLQRFIFENDMHVTFNDIFKEKSIMKKILVIGCPGAGKSTFSRKIHFMTKLRVYYLDRLFHNKDRTTVSNKIFDARLFDIVKSDHWIIDGNYIRTLEIRLLKCDTVFF